MARPEDMRCEVRVGSGRCTGEKTFDMESGQWVRCCADHLAQENKARAEGGERLEWHSEAEEEDDDD